MYLLTDNVCDIAICIETIGGEKEGRVRYLGRDKQWQGIDHGREQIMVGNNHCVILPSSLANMTLLSKKLYHYSLCYYLLYVSGEVPFKKAF